MCASIASVLASAVLLTAPAGEKPSEKPSPQPATKEIELHTIEQGVIEKTNAQRRRFGLRPLRVSPWLMRSARRHTGWMTRSRNLQHTTAPVGENIAMGQRSSSEAVGDWMTSPGHRANILNASYTRIGVAAYRTPDGTIFWCQQFLR